MYREYLQLQMLLLMLPSIMRHKLTNRDFSFSSHLLNKTDVKIIGARTYSVVSVDFNCYDILTARYLHWKAS